MTTLEELESAARVVYAAMRPTPQQRWPLLDAAVGTAVWVKHENHTPVGAFKVRGGLVYFDHLLRTQPHTKGVVAATRGNHGQSVAFAAAKYGVPAAVVVPRGNSATKNAAMRALGAELIESGHDFQASLEASAAIATERGWHQVPSFHQLLVNGVASYSIELLRAVQSIDVLYVPIGLGSGICGAIAARDALGLQTRIIGVVSAAAPAYARSFALGHPVSHEVSTRIADGMACRTPVPDALATIRMGVERIVEVSDEEIEEAMRVLFSTTHNVAEGAGAASLAALLKDREHSHRAVAAIVLTGANVDPSPFAQILGAAPCRTRTE
jgi:threonine dehydratase